ncbi:MAG: hypothetical protein Q7S79_02905 [bacterium]|nr:hypothetical protein [bacterium]
MAATRELVQDQGVQQEKRYAPGEDIYPFRNGFKALIKFVNEPDERIVSNEIPSGADVESVVGNPFIYELSPGNAVILEAVAQAVDYRTVNGKTLSYDEKGNLRPRGTTQLFKVSICRAGGMSDWDLAKDQTVVCGLLSEGEKRVEAIATKNRPARQIDLDRLWVQFCREPIPFRLRHQDLRRLGIKLVVVSTSGTFDQLYTEVNS